MKHYSYNEYTPDPTKQVVVTLSEQEILDRYWNRWKELMIKKFGKDCFEKNYTKQDCIDDWVVINWAWESN